MCYFMFVPLDYVTEWYTEFFGEGVECDGGMFAGAVAGVFDGGVSAAVVVGGFGGSVHDFDGGFDDGEATEAACVCVLRFVLFFLFGFWFGCLLLLLYFGRCG